MDMHMPMPGIRRFPSAATALSEGGDRLLMLGILSFSGFLIPYGAMMLLYRRKAAS